MGRSQRHMIVEQGANAAGASLDEGVVAPGLLMQVDGDVQKVGGGPVEVPTGAPGGPLQGSTLTGAIPSDVAPPTPPQPEPGPDPEPGMEPVLDSLDPAFAVIGSDDVTMHCHGRNFTETSVIVFNGGEENTVFVSDTEVTTIVKPSLAGTPVSVPVLVRQGTVDSNAVNFNFEVDEELPPERDVGPFDITSIADHPNGLAITLASGEVLDGDTVLIEATGNTSVNGQYEVSIVDGVIVVFNEMELAAPIEAKGRLTIVTG